MDSMLHHHDELKDPKWKGYWRPAAAVVYLVICLFDFIIMPALYSTKHAPEKLVDLSMLYSSSESQMRSLEILYRNQDWTPLTNQGGGIFHLSFGAILGAAAFGRSQEKRALISKPDQPI